MYTEFIFASEIKKETPENIISILKNMTTGDIHYEDNIEIPDHEFFKCSRWKSLFRMDSYYFDGETMSKLTYDNISKSYYLTVRSNLKNYDGEIDKFLNFISTYLPHKIEEDDLLGYSRYEESREPRLIYYSDLIGY